LVEAAPATQAVGRRKTAVARVRLKLGSGQILVNGKPVAEYFPLEALVSQIQQPFDATNTVGRYDAFVSVRGGGVTGQAGAVRHGIARAIETLDPATRTPLKGRGLLTRDARKKERKKYGQRGARARFQFSKR